jgi:hypothetical protein
VAKGNTPIRNAADGVAAVSIYINTDGLCSQVVRLGIPEWAFDPAPPGSSLQLGLFLLARSASPSG